MKDEFDSIFDGGHNDVEPTELNENTITEETIDPVEPEIAEEPEPEPDHEKVEEVSTDEAKPRTVPVAALHDTRDKLKEEKRRADEAERQLAEYKNQQAQPVPVIPDPYDDPQGYNSAIEAKIEARFTAYKLNSSRERAIEKHGEETTQAAIEWAVSRSSSDPAFEHAAIAKDNPVQWVIDQHKRHTELSEFESDRESFIRREAAKLGLTGTTITSNNDATVIPTIKPDGIKNTAPRSLATVNSATKHTKETDHVDDFDSIFIKR